MSRFFSDRHSKLVPYVPGEQPKDSAYIKLNTNESPFSPPESVRKAVSEEALKLNLYNDPECTALINAAAKHYGVEPENLIAVNGSDEILYFSFLAYGDEAHPFAFPDITYGFYPVYADINNVPVKLIPLADDFSVRASDYCGIGMNVVIANPNAPTGMLLPIDEIESIVRTNADNVVIIDEAYIDFGGESAVRLIKKYPNLIVTQTFSKSRSMAGARLGFGIADKALIADLNIVRNSVNPYNVNRMTQVAGVAALKESNLFASQNSLIAEIRDNTAAKLTEKGFTVLPSAANFIFIKSAKASGEELYRELRARGILVRHFNKVRIKDFCRVTIGTEEQMQTFLEAVTDIISKKERS